MSMLSSRDVMLVALTLALTASAASASARALSWRCSKAEVAPLVGPVMTKSTLLWSAEFDPMPDGVNFVNGGIDITKFNFMTGDGSAYGIPERWGNWEQECYVTAPANAHVTREGYLAITAVRVGGDFQCANPNAKPSATYADGSYTSAKLSTAGLFEFVYTPEFPVIKVSARVKAPLLKGAWPAFWMLPSSHRYGPWCTSGEIDIMEIADDVPTVFGTLHYGGQPTAPWQNCAGDGATTTITDDWHEYAVVWSASNLTFMVDDVVYHVSPVAGWDQSLVDLPATDSAPFDAPFYIMLNLAVGSPTYQNGFTKKAADWAQATMFVDWVRVHGL